MDLFAHVTEQGRWDGHTTEEKYERLGRVGDDLASLANVFLPRLHEIFKKYEAADA